MKCPRCETSSLTELDRDGVTIDRCDRCRGIWLDRGELEKLIANQSDAQPSTDDDDDDDSGDGPRDNRRGRGPERRRWWEIFD